MRTIPKHMAYREDGLGSRFYGLLYPKTVLEAGRERLLAHKVQAQWTKSRCHLDMLVVEHTYEDSIDTRRDWQARSFILPALLLVGEVVPPIREFVLCRRSSILPDVLCAELLALERDRIRYCCDDAQARVHHCTRI